MCFLQNNDYKLIVILFVTFLLRENGYWNINIILFTFLTKLQVYKELLINNIKAGNESVIKTHDAIMTMNICTRKLSIVMNHLVMRFTITKYNGLLTFAM